MSEDSTAPDLVTRMREAVEAFNRSDVDAVMSFFAADAVFESPVLGSHFEGAAAIRTFAEDWLGAFEEWAVELDEILDLGNGVVFVVYSQEGRPVGSSGLIRSQAVSVYQWAGGVVARATTYADIDEGRAAAERLAEERGQATYKENVERLRATYEAFNLGKQIDVEALTFDVEFKQPDELGGGEGVYYGPEGFIRGTQELLDVFEDFRAVPEKFIDAGAYIVVYVRLRGRARLSGVPIDDPYAHVVRFRGERVDLWHAYSDRREALKAVGLEG